MEGGREGGREGGSTLWSHLLFSPLDNDIPNTMIVIFTEEPSIGSISALVMGGSIGCFCSIYHNLQVITYQMHRDTPLTYFRLVGGKRNLSLFPRAGLPHRLCNCVRCRSVLCRRSWRRQVECPGSL